MATEILQDQGSLDLAFEASDANGAAPPRLVESNGRTTRSKLNDERAANAEMRQRLDSFHPTLVVQARGGDPFEQAVRVPPDGAGHNLSMLCGPRAVVVGVDGTR